MKKNGVFLFVISHLVPEIFKIFVLCKLGTDDVIRCDNIEDVIRCDNIEDNIEDVINGRLIWHRLADLAVHILKYRLFDFVVYFPPQFNFQEI